MIGLRGLWGGNERGVSSNKLIVYLINKNQKLDTRL